MEALRRHADGSITLALHVQPGAKRTEFAGKHGDALKLRLAAPPVEGKANTALIAFISEFCRLPRNSVVLQSGDTSRQKVLRISGADLATIARLESLLKPA